MPVVVTHVCDVCGATERYPGSSMHPMRMLFDDNTRQFRVELMCQECWEALHAAAQEAIGERKTHAGQAQGD